MTGLVIPPRLIVETGGTPLERHGLLGLAQVRVQQCLSLPAQCELTFRDPPGSLEPVLRITAGASLRVALDGVEPALFLGDVTATEQIYGPAGGREVRIRGYDALHRLRQRQSIRAHVNVTVAELAKSLVGELGLSVAGPQRGALWRILIQHRKSDLELLTEVALQSGLYFVVDDGVLRLVTLQGEGDPLPLSLGTSLLEGRVELNGAGVADAIAIQGWDPLTAVSHQGRSSSQRVGLQVGAGVTPQQMGTDGLKTLVNELVQDVQHAELLAQAELDRRAMRAVVLWGVAEGDPRLRPGALVEVSGLHSSAEGRYVLSAVTHTVDMARGFLSEISTAPPPAAVPSPAAVASLGTVTQVDDPDALGRVRVSLPAYGDVETEWMPVLSLGGGPAKGLIMIPEVGDQVLVLLPYHDPSCGIVLGGLYAMTAPPDTGVEGGEVKRYTLVTSGGQRLQFDDVRNSLRIENGAGSFLELAPSTVLVHAATDLVIEAPGKSVTVRGQSINFERG